METRISQRPLDTRITARALAFGFGPRFDPVAAGDALEELAAGNMTALERALKRVSAALRSRPSPVAVRAAEALTLALARARARLP